MVGGPYDDTDTPGVAAGDLSLERAGGVDREVVEEDGVALLQCGPRQCGGSCLVHRRGSRRSTVGARDGAESAISRPLLEDPARLAVESVGDERYRLLE
nr:hypothetical protein [Halomicroarcula sp. ZS-22-S1]